MELLTIGQMAKMNGVTPQTLRLYDEIGLLVPRDVGDGNKYRYYDISQCARLDMIQYMKSLGMELRVIKEQLDKKDIGLLKAILEQKRDDVERQTRELEFQKRAIERALTAYELYESAPPDGGIVLQYIPRRFIYTHDSGMNFYDHGIEVYEEILRELKRDMLRHRLPHIYFSNAGTILRRERVLERCFHATEFFVFVDRDFVAADLITSLPGGMFLCIYCDRFDKEREYSLRLFDEADRRGFAITGDCYCEVVIDSPVFEYSRDDMFFRIQLPITFGEK